MSAYVGSSKNLKDLKDLKDWGEALAYGGRIKNLMDLKVRQPFALEGWILEILYCDPKGDTAFMRILCTKG